MLSSKILRFSSLLLISSLAIGVSYVNPVRAASLYRVSQESAPGLGDFDGNILGFIEPFVTTQTAIEYYQYDKPIGFSFNGILPALKSNTSHLFLVNARDGLSLFMIHDRPRDSNGGFASMEFTLMGDNASVQFLDDPEDSAYTSSTHYRSNEFTINSTWLSCCTDGGIIGTLEDKWMILAHFKQPTSLNSSHLAEWKAFSANDKDIELSLQIEQRVRIEAMEQPQPSQVHEPRVILGILLAGGISLSKLYKKCYSKKLGDRKI